jgi:hypothetical protein
VHDEIDMTIRYEPGEANEASQLIFPKPNVVIRPNRGGAVPPPINVSGFRWDKEANHPDVLDADMHPPILGLT